MKKVLILGANSYIGNSFQKYIGENYNDQYEVHKVSLRGEAWKEDDWSGYDSILNVTGKAHADIGILTEEQKQEYYAVNCDLACEAAQKAVKDGVGQYIYLSSVIVYGDSSNGGGAIHITKDTKPAPSNFYGDSKWQAEQKLQALFEGLKVDARKNNIVLAIVRPPMIYGKILIEDQRTGVFLPQNASCVTTAQMVAAIATAKGKNVHLCNWMNPFVVLAKKMPGKIGGMAGK